MKLSKISIPFPALAVAALLAACGGDTSTVSGPVATLSPEDKAAKVDDEPVSPGGPVQISHRVVGTPIVGQPLSIDLSLKSMGAAAPLRVDYRINDGSALVFAEQQVKTTTALPDSQSLIAEQQVTVVPQREGRLYLNVSVGIETDMGMSSTVMAIPIQVGSGPRSFEENGTLATDTNGNAIRVLPASQR